MTPKTPPARLSRGFRLFLALWGGLPSIALFAVTLEPVALAVPLAGPWAAWLYEHSCGVDQHMPLATAGLVLGGLGSLILAFRRRRPWAWLPAALVWWPAWLLAAAVSAINAHE